MLDSNVLIDIAREPEGAVAQNFIGKGRSEIAIGPIVSGEVRFGMEARPDARSNPSMAFLLKRLRVVALEPPADSIYGKLRLDLKLRGKGLSANDYWIAAHAISRDAILVTGDRAFHDAEVKELKLADWRDDPGPIG